MLVCQHALECCVLCAVWLASSAVLRACCAEGHPSRSSMARSWLSCPDIRKTPLPRYHHAGAVPHLLATVLHMSGPRTQTIITNEFRSQVGNRRLVVWWLWLVNIGELHGVLSSAAWGQLLVGRANDVRSSLATERSTLLLLLCSRCTTSSCSSLATTLRYGRCGVGPHCVTAGAPHTLEPARTAHIHAWREQRTPLAAAVACGAKGCTVVASLTQILSCR